MQKEISKKEAKERIEKLKPEINRYRYSYAVQDKSLISDEALDSLKKELFDLETKYPDLITPDSPTQRVAGRPLEGFKKVKHESPMISFNDAFSEEDMEDWLTRVENYLGKLLHDASFYCELKIDGLAIELVYENGIFAEGSTRGDGLVGEDVTQNLKTVEAIPLSLTANSYKLPARLVVRGEVFLTTKEFLRINKEQVAKGEKAYANPRNVAAGTIRQLDPKIVASRKLDSFAYEIIDGNFKTHEEKHDYLHKLGFKTNTHNKHVNSLKEVFKFRDYWEKEREKLPYEIDGVVVMINDEKTLEDAGVIGKAPRAAIAYKFSPREATAQVLDIKVQVGRTGALTPVAELTPTQVGGVTIQHSTLHNYDEIQRLGLKIGDTVIVTRSGDVIPKITGVLKDLRTGKEKEFKMPIKCPVDGSPVVVDGAIYRCSNPNCGARLRENLYHFVSRNAYNIDGLGPKIIDRFLDEGLITDAADLFILTQDDIKTLERFGEKSAENLVSEIQAHRKISLERFIYSLGILHIGDETARLLSRRLDGSGKLTISKFTKEMTAMSLEDLQSIRDIGPKVAQSVYDWFKERSNIKFLERLEENGVEIIIEKKVFTNSKITGKKFVITGSLESMSRDQAKDKIRDLGGEVSDSVTSKTDYLVAGAEAGSKLEKAQKLGIKVLDEKAFKELLS